MAAFVSHGRREENAFKQRSIVDHLGEREILSMYRPSTVVIHELTRMVTPALARPKNGFAKIADSLTEILPNLPRSSNIL